MSTGTVRPLRAAVLGAGLMGRWHGAAVRRAGHTVAAVFDPDAARAARLAREWGAVVSPSPEAAVAECDVVHVCTPLPTHVTLATLALEAGRSVLCEKPIAEQAGDVRALFALAASRGALLVPTHQFLWQRGMLRLQRELPTLGAVRHVDTVACTAGASGRDAMGREAVALDVLPHPLSLIERLVPGALDAMSWSVPHGIAGELRAASSHGGTTFGILVSCSGRPPINLMSVIAEQGTVTVDLFHGFAQVDRGRASRWQKIGQPFSAGLRQAGAAATNLAERALRGESAYPGLRELIARTYAAVQHDSAPPVSAQESIAVAEACDRIRMLRTIVQ